MSERLTLEGLLSSRGRVKIIKTIFKYGEVNVTRITRESGLNHKTVKRHLNYLVTTGLINERTYGRVKLYSINYFSPKALLLRDLLFAIEG